MVRTSHSSLENYTKEIVEMRNVVLVTAMVFEIMTLLSCNKKNDKSGIAINRVVSQSTMEEIYSEVKTPFKYGVVLKHADSTKLIDRGCARSDLCRHPMARHPWTRPSVVPVVDRIPEL